MNKLLTNHIPYMRQTYLVNVQATEAVILNVFLINFVQSSPRGQELSYLSVELGVGCRNGNTSGS